VPGLNCCKSNRTVTVYLPDATQTSNFSPLCEAATAADGLNRHHNRPARQDGRERVGPPYNRAASAAASEDSLQRSHHSSQPHRKAEITDASQSAGGPARARAWRGGVAFFASGAFRKPRGGRRPRGNQQAMTFSTTPLVCLTLAKWETVPGQFGGYLTMPTLPSAIQ